MNQEALEETLSTGRVCYWSRSRRSLWRKGETSGNVQRLVQCNLDCDGDALLLLVDQSGPRVPHRRAKLLFQRTSAGQAAASRRRRLSSNPRHGEVASTPDANQSGDSLCKRIAPPSAPTMSAAFLRSEPIVLARSQFASGRNRRRSTSRGPKTPKLSDDQEAGGDWTRACHRW